MSIITLVSKRLICILVLKFDFRNGRVFVTWWQTLLLLLPDSLWLYVVAPERVLSMGQVELNSVLMLN